MSTTTPNHPDDDIGSERGRDPAYGAEGGHDDAAAGNPYAAQYHERAAEPDLDAAAPQLRSSEMRRMNQRALLLLGAVVLLLLLVAYWMISGAMKPRGKTQPREEKVTVAEAPAAVALPALPRAVASSPAAQPIPLMPAPAPKVSSDADKPAAPAPSSPSLLQRRIMADTDLQGGAGNATSTNAKKSSSMLASSGLPGSGPDARANAAPLRHPDTLMQRGTYIRCILETRINSDVSGYSTCLVAEPVYSFNGHTLLLPKGSKILGSYKGKQTQHRVEVIWDRIITPTGIDVSMESPGIDNLGGSGLPGHYDAHWGSRIGAALLISMLSDAFKYEAAKHGPTTTSYSSGVVTQEPFESNTAQTVQSLANQAVQEAANRAPTVTIHQGTLIYVYVSKDIDFSGVVSRF